MTKAICRVGDKDSDRDVITTGASTVFINGRAAALSSKSVDSARDTKLKGSSSVFIEGMPAHRVGDRDTDRNVSVEGSPDVFVG